jgi:hypothetical protein
LNIFKIIALSFIFILAGCAVKPANYIPADYSYPEKAKIGYMSALPKKPTHKHTGLTAIGNFEKDLGVNWKLDDFIYSSLRDYLEEKYCYKLINLSDNSNVNEYLAKADTPKRANGLVVADEKFTKELGDTFGEYDLSGFIFVVGYKIFHMQPLEKLALAQGRESAYGIETNRAKGSNQFSSAIGTRAYSLKENHYIGGHGLGTYRKEVGFEVADYENLTTEELDMYEKFIKNEIKSNVALLAEKLPKPSGQSCKI